MLRVPEIALEVRFDGFNRPEAIVRFKTKCCTLDQLVDAATQPGDDEETEQLREDYRRIMRAISDKLYFRIVRQIDGCKNCSNEWSCLAFVLTDRDGVTLTGEYRITSRYWRTWGPPAAERDAEEKVIGYRLATMGLR